MGTEIRDEGLETDRWQDPILPVPGGVHESCQFGIRPDMDRGSRLTGPRAAGQEKEEKKEEKGKGKSRGGRSATHLSSRSLLLVQGGWARDLITPLKSVSQ